VRGVESESEGSIPNPSTKNMDSSPSPKNMDWSPAVVAYTLGLE